jgi:hypothetical protein
MDLLIRFITIFKHVKIFNGFSQVGDLYYNVISSKIQSKGPTPFSESINIENSAKLLFLNVDLVWKYEFRHKGQNKVTIEIAYIPQFVSLNFRKVNKGICKLLSNRTYQKNCPFNKM